MTRDLPDPMPPGDVASDDRFDAALRACHRAALGHLSPRAQAQLQQRLRAAFAPAGPRARRPAWAMAAACSLALVVVVGIHRRALDDTAAPSPQPVAAASSDSAELVATLDEAPDLYLWLASDDANDILSE